MPTYKISLSADTMSAVLSASDDARELLARDLCEEDSGLLGMMSHYCRDDRGTPAYASLRIDPENMGLQEDLTGTVLVEFQEQAYYGCANMDIQDDHEVEIPFRIARESRCLTIEVPQTSRISDFHGGQDEEPGSNPTGSGLGDWG